MNKRRPLNEEELLAMLESESDETRLNAAAFIMGRDIRPGEKNIFEHLVGTMSADERYANLLLERASERGVDKEVQTVTREKATGGI